MALSPDMQKHPHIKEERAIISREFVRMLPVDEQ